MLTVNKKKLCNNELIHAVFIFAKKLTDMATKPISLEDAFAIF